MREKELARMSWKVKPEDLLPTHMEARGQFGSRYSLGKLSMTGVNWNEWVLLKIPFNLYFQSKRGSLDSMAAAKKGQVFVSTAIYKVWYLQRTSFFLNNSNLTLFYFQGNLVAYKKLSKSKFFNINRNLLIELKRVSFLLSGISRGTLTQPFCFSFKDEGYASWSFSTFYWGLCRKPALVSAYWILSPWIPSRYPWRWWYTIRMEF